MRTPHITWGQHIMHFHGGQHCQLSSSLWICWMDYLIGNYNGLTFQGLDNLTFDIRISVCTFGCHNCADVYTLSCLHHYTISTDSYWRNSIRAIVWANSHSHADNITSKWLIPLWLPKSLPTLQLVILHCENLIILCLVSFVSNFLIGRCLMDVSLCTLTWSVPLLV